MEDNLFDSGNIFNGESPFENIAETPDGQKPGTGDKKDNNPTEEIQFNPETDLFGDDDREDNETPESVGKGDEKKEPEDSEDKTVAKGDGSSPKENVYSSFAQALKGDGLFQNLDDDTVKGIDSGEAFYEALEREIDARLDEKTRRINDALNAGVAPDTVKQYEATIKQLDNISEEQLSEESERGKKLRTAIIKQDFINRRFSKERAEREARKAVDNATDIEDAKDALESVKEYFKEQYNDIVQKGREEAEEQRKEVRRQAEDFKKSILNDKVFGELNLDRAVRLKAYDLMTKPVKTTDDGERLTAVQAYADEHPVEFRTMLGIVAALTDGFTRPGNLFKGAVEKKVRQNLAGIEKKLNQSSHWGGTLSLAEGEDSSPESHKGKFRLDIDNL